MRSFCRVMRLEYYPNFRGDTRGATKACPGARGGERLLQDGGTVDVTVHEVKPDGTLKELHKASGGAWGGTKVDQAYMELYENLLGKDVMEEFKHKSKFDFLDMHRDFEIKKRNLNIESENINIRLSAALADHTKEMTNKTVAKNVEIKGFSDRINDRKLISDCFSKFVTIDENVDEDDMKSREYEIRDKQAPFEITVYASTDENPVMVTDADCVKLGRIEVKPPIGGWRQKAKVTVEFGFGGTEVRVTATENLTQIQHEVTFDFLS
ncbi:HS12A-like protein [Mya arenaria]|uniref:HS12A-like protein n=1 Tax=Mya arenaria TaxID=6604 RepID=A0ABY7DQY9_MYAAR|nr:HS12A-like protein [Mya arenaria]